MESTALYIGNLQVGWSSFIIVLAALVWLCCACSLISIDGGKQSVIWVSFPFTVVLSILISRFLNWYCHPEMYGSLKEAMEGLLQNSNTGGYEMPGVLAGIALSALIAGRMRSSGGTLYLLDVMAPGTALGMAILFLTDRFGIGCRGKVTFETAPIDPELLLFVYDGTSYRMALYVVQFIVLALIFALTFLYKLKFGDRALVKGEAEGSTAVFFLLLLSAAEVPLDSARYDTSFLRSNGFVSFLQIISAVIFITVLVVYSIRSVKANGLKVLHWIGWGLFAAALGGTIYCEYLVQRHGSWYIACYSWMSVCCIVMAVICIGMHISNFEDAETAEAEEPDTEEGKESEVESGRKAGPEAENESGKDAAKETDTGTADTSELSGKAPDDRGNYGNERAASNACDPAVYDTSAFDTSDLVLLDINNGAVQRFDRSYKESPEEKEYRKALADSLGIISRYEDDYRILKNRAVGSETYAFNTETLNSIRERYDDKKIVISASDLRRSDHESEYETDEALMNETKNDNKNDNKIEMKTDMGGGQLNRYSPRTTFPTNITVYTRDKRSWKKRRKR